MNKEKILSALNLALDDISEDRLLDILLDLYEAKKERIKQLEGENCHERQILQSEREQLREEYRRMRGDPLYGPSGEYFFLVDGDKIRVIVRSGRFELLKRIKGVDYLGQQIAPDLWQRL